MNVVGLLLTEIVPLCCSMMLFVIPNPKPVPVDFEVKRGSNMCGNISSGHQGLNH